MPEFLESPRFPLPPNYGYIAAPRLLTHVASVQSGRTNRNRVWQYPLQLFTCTVGPRAQNLIEDLREFWYAVGGREVGFRFKDYADFKSCRLGQTPSALDQPAIRQDGSPQSWQLFKRYSKGGREQYRPIQKPTGTILVAADGELQTAGVDYGIDMTTGVLTPIGGAWDGSPEPVITWGGEFDVPVWFQDEEFPVLLENLRVQTVSFALKEERISL